MCRRAILASVACAPRGHMDCVFLTRWCCAVKTRLFAYCFSYGYSVVTDDFNEIVHLLNVHQCDVGTTGWQRGIPESVVRDSLTRVSERSLSPVRFVTREGDMAGIHPSRHDEDSGSFMRSSLDSPLKFEMRGCREVYPINRGHFGGHSPPYGSLPLPVQSTR
jgi:hypothetical protein